MFTKRFLGYAVAFLAAVVMVVPASAQNKHLAIATGGTGGGYYPMGGSIANLIQSKIPGTNATAQVTAASIENAKLLQRNECQLGLMSGAISYGYVDKKLQPLKYEGLSSIMAAGFADTLTVVLKDSPIKSMADLKGKRIGIGAPGSATETVNKLVLSGWGLFDLKTQEINFKPEYLSYAEISAALKDRRIDAGMYLISGRPGPAITDIALTHNIRIISYEDDKVAKLEKTYPFMSRTVYPKGLYKGVDDDSVVVKVPDVFACRTDLPVDLVYNITKSVHENLPELKKSGYHGFSYWELSRVVDGVFPLHPGAAKYYDELKIK